MSTHSVQRISHFCQEGLKLCICLQSDESVALFIPIASAITDRRGRSRVLMLVTWFGMCRMLVIGHMTPVTG